MLVLPSQERMVADDVSGYGSIARSQAAQLCQVSPAQPRAVLERLVDREAYVSRVNGKALGTSHSDAL